MSSKKIWQYPEATSITNDDYILMDSNTETGSQCLKANKIGAVHITKTVTERKVYKASDDNANGFSEVTVAVPYTDVHYDKDDIVSFVGEDLPLKSVTAYIEPQQDLHGYDSPWVGGAGKNKFDVDLPHEEVSGSTTYSYTVTVKPNTAYTMSCNAPQGSPASLYFNGTATNVNGVWNGTPRTFTSDSNGQLIVYVRYDTSQGGIDLYTAVKNGTYYIQLEEGSSATSYAPYSNICPISGWDEGNVSVCGTNVWDEEWEVGAISNVNGENYALAERIRSKNYISVKANTPYYLYLLNTYSSARIACYDKDKTYLGQATGWLSVNNNTAFTTPSNTYYIRFVVVKADETYNHDISINYPSTDTEYHAYNGSTITIPFLDAQGNPIEVYGGKLDVVNGGGSAYRNVVIFDGTETFTAYGTTFVCSKILPEGLTTSGDDIICSHAIRNYISFSNSTKTTVQFKGDYFGVSTVEEFKALLASWVSSNKPLQFSYELATPTTFYTQPTSISSQSGVNNVWADCGPVAVEWQTLYVTPTT